VSPTPHVPDPPTRPPPQPRLPYRSWHQVSSERGRFRIHLETMKGLRDLSSIATAPALEELLLVDMSHLLPEDLTPLIGHPNLKTVTLGLGSLRKNEAAQRLLGLPETRDLKIGWREV
jgi:hypothetical protein